MSLRQQAAADLATLVEDRDGFGWDIRVTPPDGLGVDLVGLSTDVATSIDPETGQAVSGRTASVALRIASLEAAGMGIPVNVHDRDRFPWVVEFRDIHGAPHRFKVVESRPDRAIGIVVCLLEAYG